MRCIIEFTVKICEKTVIDFLERNKVISYLYISETVEVSLIKLFFLKIEIVNSK